MCCDREFYLETYSILIKIFLVFLNFMSLKPEKTKSFDPCGFFVWPCVAFVVRFGLAVRRFRSSVCLFGCSVCLYARLSVPVSAVCMFGCFGCPFLSVPVRSCSFRFRLFRLSGDPSGCLFVRSFVRLSVPAVRLFGGSGRAEPGGLYAFLFRSSRWKGKSLFTYWISRLWATASRCPGRAGKSLFTYRLGRPWTKTPRWGVTDLLIWVRGVRGIFTDQRKPITPLTTPKNKKRLDNIIIP